MTRLSTVYLRNRQNHAKARRAVAGNPAWKNEAMSI